MSKKASAMCADKLIVAARFAAVPAELKALDRWVVWKYLPLARDARPGAKPRKCPCDAITGEATDGTRIESGKSFAAAVAWFERGGYDGIGFILGDGIGGIDCDDGLREDGTLDAVGLGLVEAFNTYLEVSPSRSGFKGFVLLDRNRVGHIGKKRAQEELYSGKRFFTVTGQALSGSAAKLADCTDAFLAMAERLSARNLIGEVASRDGLPADAGEHFLRFHQPASIGQAVEWLWELDPDDEEPTWFQRRMLPWALQFGWAGFDAFDDWSSTAKTRYRGTDDVREKYQRAMDMNEALPISARPEDVATIYTIRRDAEQLAAPAVPPRTSRFRLETAREIMESGADDFKSVLGVLLNPGLHIFAGPGGQGKSTVLATAGACVTNGVPLPPWERADTRRAPAAVLWLTVEEDMRNIVVPRHVHLKGDIDLFFRPTIERVRDEKGQWHAVDFDIEQHLRDLLDQAKRVGTPIALVVCDSLPGLIQWGSSPSGKARSTTSDTDVKAVLGRLNQIGIDYGCCIAGIAHWNKKHDLPEAYRVSGAQAWRDTPRVSFTINSGSIYIAKANDMPPVGCTFEHEVVAVLREVPAETADGQPIKITARRAVFGECLVDAQRLLGSKRVDSAEPLAGEPGAARLPAVRGGRRLDRLCQEAQECFDLVGGGSLPSSVVWRAVGEAYSAPNGAEKKDVIRRLGLVLDKSQKPVVLSIGGANK